MKMNWKLIVGAAAVLALLFFIFKGKVINDTGSAELMGGKTASAVVDRVTQGLNDALKLLGGFAPTSSAPGL